MKKHPVVRSQTKPNQPKPPVPRQQVPLAASGQFAAAIIRRMIHIVLLTGLVMALFCACSTVPCTSEKEAAVQSKEPLTWYRFDAAQPMHGFCEEQVFGKKQWVAEPSNFLFSLTTLFLGLFAVLRARRTTMAFQFVFSFLAAYGAFSAVYHVTIYNGIYRMMDVALTFVQSFTIVMLIHSLYLYRLKVSDTDEEKKRYRYLTNLCTVLFTLYPGIVHVTGESSANPWVAWLTFDLLWILIATLLILIWKRRKKWPGATGDETAFKLVWSIIATCVIAYTGWCLDKFLCSCQTPWPAWLHLHGIWHLFMGLCFYLMINLSRFLNAHEYGYRPVLQHFPQKGKIRIPFVEWE
ncbi:MAG: ceramidase domain-containing protein [Deltaproteobacteria bacterium]|nr:ceramidase domain-containing protein [Deltaproteobacteria bacterium]